MIGIYCLAPFVVARGTAGVVLLLLWPAELLQRGEMQEFPLPSRKYPTCDYTQDFYQYLYYIVPSTVFISNQSS